MSDVTLGLFSIALLFVSILLGVHIMIALGVLGAVGLMLLSGFDGATSTLSSIFFSSTASFHFSVIPMFLLMGYFAMGAKLGEDLFDAAAKWFGRLPGGLAVATTCSAAAFGASSGSSVGTAMVFTKLALPEMLRYGYDKGLAAASIAVSGTLAALIPPSALMVVYCLLTDTSVGRMLLAGVLPGILFTLLICIGTMAAVMLNPRLAPPVEQRYTWRQKIYSIRLVAPLILVVVAIISGLYFGFFTPTEAGAIGVLLTFALAIIRQRGLKGIRIPAAVVNTVQTTCMVFGIIICALIYSRFLAFSGVSEEIGNLLLSLELSNWAVLLMVTGIYIVLGMIMDAPAMLSVSLPVIHPVMMQLGFDPIWFGIYVVLLVELGAITPPVGMNCFVVKGAAGDLLTLQDVYRGIIPYIFAALAALFLLYQFPEIALYLPNSMKD